MTRTFSFPPGPFEATVEVPGDKSLSHRALILAAIAAGSSTVRGLPAGLDVGSTRAVTAALGVQHCGADVTSAGRPAWSAPHEPLDCGNSGTTMRLMAGALASSPVGATLNGDRSLSMRPMARLVPPLTALGADISVSTEGRAPVTVRGRALRGGDVAIPIASAQVRSAVALAALGADGPSRIDSPPGFRDHTERWLQALGRGEYETPTRFRVDPGPIPPLDITVPGDPSSAAFLWAAAAVRPGATVVTPSISANSGRLGFLEILESMGAVVEVSAEEPLLGDAVASVTVTGNGLHGVDVDGAMSARALDELTLLAVVAAVADGSTRVRDAGELRHKESDRIAAAVGLAAGCGAMATPHPDGFEVVPGSTGRGGAAIDAGGDHRIAMAGAIAAVCLGSSVSVAGADATDVSWPGFAEVMEGLWS